VKPHGRGVGKSDSVSGMKDLLQAVTRRAKAPSVGALLLLLLAGQQFTWPAAWLAASAGEHERTRPITLTL
jgi:hypothetical protein